jgi:cytidine deaminase
LQFLFFCFLHFLQLAGKFPGKDGFTMKQEYLQLIQRAAAARKNAYAPYSGFAVGAALLCADGTVFTGCNVENASYPAGICAERSALFAAVSAGKRRFSAIAIAAGEDPTAPCGICRQAFAEFGKLDVLCANQDGSRCRMFSLRELLPEAFSLLPPASPKG